MPEPNRPHWYGRGLSLSEDLVPRINNSNAKEWMALLILQKTLSAFVELPGLLILILLAFTLFAKMSRGWRRVLSVLIVVFYLCSAGFFSQWLVAPLENHFATSYAQEVGVDASQSAIVILSSSHRVGVPSGYGGEVTNEPDRTTALRLNRGFSLYRERPMPIIVSGGPLWSSHQVHVAETMAETLAMWGVPEKDIVIEDRAMTTDQNAAYSLALLDEAVATVYIVTSAIHLPRAMLAFEREAKKRSSPLWLVPIPTDFYIEERETIWLDFLPSSGAFTATAAALHEWFGLLFYKWFK